MQGKKLSIVGIEGKKTLYAEKRICANSLRWEITSYVLEFERRSV